MVGIDIGQRVDPTAIAVAELDERRTDAGRLEDHYLIRHLERLPLQTPYPTVADRLAQIVAGVKANSGRVPEVRVDATGVGLPVCDVLTAAGVSVTPCFFTHGDRLIEETQPARISVGKAYLVSRLQALLQTGRIHLPHTAEADALAKELLDFEIKIDEDGNDRYGAFRVGTHDDLVTALGLAVLIPPPGPGIWF
jgi:hypothetical protein